MKWLAVICFVLLPLPAAAEWQIKPFFGIAFGGSTSFVDYENAAGRKHFVVGVGASLLGDVLGLEADVARAPGFFESGGEFVSGSSATTLTGNIVVSPYRSGCLNTRCGHILLLAPALFARKSTADLVPCTSRARYLRWIWAAGRPGS